ncbi:hypothetical protein QQ045_013298 [Rhodiola kirilowii]
MGDNTCVFCKVTEESRNHLFFECRFTKEVWSDVMKFLNVLQAPCNWELLIPWFKGLIQKRIKTKLIAASCTRVMNVIWLARNAKFFKDEDTYVISLVRNMIWFLKMKIGAIKKEACDKEDLDWLTNMNFID